MLNTKSFLCLDFGAGSLKIAEFEPTESGVIRLKEFGIKSLGFEGSQDVARERVINRVIQELLAEHPFSSRDVNACAPGFHVFSKFVKLPPVDSSKVTQIIQYEAQQNVPFPLEEVVWDYQILGTSPAGELEVLLVAIKTDVVEGLFRTAEASGFRVQLVDVSPAALCNAFRFNYSDLEGCSMLLDIGAKTSNLLFFDKGKVYARSINIGANSITQDFASEAKLRFAEAEQLKIAEGFVSLGGAYEEPENPRQAQISKIARQVMTRLHIQVNQTIQFFRGQQGGSPPQRLFLAGGAAIMPYTAQFFAEKLNIAVEYFNPFRNVEISPSVNREELAAVAHSLGEIVGLGLRNVAQCPVEMNLMPRSWLKRQELNQKKPYFIATVISLVLVVAAYGWFYAKLSSIKSEALETISRKIQPISERERRLKTELSGLGRQKSELQQLQAWAQERLQWPDLLAELRRVLMATEEARKQAMGGIENGLWIESFAAANPILTAQASDMETASAGTPTTPTAVQLRYAKLLRERYGIKTVKTTTEDESDSEGAEGGEGAVNEDGTPVVRKPKGKKTSTNEIAVIKMTCRGVNHLKLSMDPKANNDLAFTFLDELKASPMVDPEETKLAGEFKDDGDTFTFGVNLRLKNPVILNPPGSIPRAPTEESAESAGATESAPSEQSQ